MNSMSPWRRGVDMATKPCSDRKAVELAIEHATLIIGAARDLGDDGVDVPQRLLGALEHEQLRALDVDDQGVDRIAQGQAGQNIVERIGGEMLARPVSTTSGQRVRLSSPTAKMEFDMPSLLHSRRSTSVPGRSVSNAHRVW